MFFVGDVINGVGLGLFGQGYWAPTTIWKYFTQCFSAT